MQKADLNALYATIRKLEQKVPIGNVRNNDYWKGYRKAIEELWDEADRLEAK